jgi:2-hydroxychromene-2-carboxylate isomerase
MPMTKPLTFYFDFISPYAYIGWKTIHAVAARHSREVTAVPILFAALLDAHGTLGPAEIPAKRVYVFKDALRKAHAAGLPFGPPPAHPFNPLLALRVATACTDIAMQASVIHALFDRVWGSARSGVTEVDVVANALSAIGVAPAALLERASGTEVKALVKANTAAAIAKGVFGVPTVEVDGELFWGVDSFTHVEQRLQGMDPIETTDLSQWAALPVQASRMK